MGLLLLCCTLGSAATIVVTDVDRNRGESIWLNEKGTNVSAYFAGVLLISLTENGSTVNRDTLCVDLFTDIMVSQTYGSTVIHPYEVSGKDLGRVSWLVDNALLPAQSDYSSALPSDYWVTSAAAGAGIQLAIWDIVHDHGDGLYAGSVQAAVGSGNQVTDSGVVTAAEYYLAESYGKTSSLAFVYNNVDLGSHLAAQMLAGPKFEDGGPSPNPEPSTLVMVGAALVVVGRMARRGKRITPAAK